jgi:hypothetical protein
MALIGEISDNSTNRTRRDGLTIKSGSRHEAFAMNETMVETEVTYTLAHEGKFYISYLAFTDAVWRKEDPPTEVKASFDSDHPTMGWVDDVLVAIAKHGFELIGHFTLPDEAW